MLPLCVSANQRYVECEVTQLNVRREEVQNTSRRRYKAQREERSRQGGFKGQTFTQESVVCVP